MSSTLVYIMGRGHSGSTILDALIGNGDNSFSIGEIVSGCLREEDVCSCGKKIRNCDFWNKVKENFEVRSESSWQEMGLKIKDQAHINKYLKTTSGTYPETTNLISLNKDLIDSISDVSGKEIIIDSSKEVTRGMFLAKYFDNVKIIHLIRNPFDIFSSNIKRIENGEFKFLRHTFKGKHYKFLFVTLSAISWLIGNLFAEIVCKISKIKVLKVKYEDLCEDTVKTMNTIQDYTGIELSNTISSIETKSELSIEHMIAGNGLRRKGAFVFNPNMEVKSIPIHIKVVTSIICFPLLIKYGYLK